MEPIRWGKNFKASTKQKRNIKSIQLSSFDVGRILLHDRQNKVHVRHVCVCASSVDGPFDTRQADDKIELINDVTV